MSEWTIYLCSHDARVRARWRSAFEAGVRLVEIDGLDSLHRYCQGLDSELILLHFELSGLDDESGVMGVCGAYPDSPLLVLANLPDEKRGIAVLGSGARGFANTYIDPPLLAKATAALQGGEIWVGRKLMTRLIEAAVRVAAETNPPGGMPALDQLTEREREIAILIGTGASNKRIAIELGITERTVKAHLGSIFDKTPANDRLQLALIVNGLPI